ncbi:MAG TPA: methyltransferase domain-containing protein, partial [Candidatus Yonathbacteria bacterium]|nr:methyltransferase domain-containing protein [Candidatus Yonathbacteria bacterium]
MFKCDSPWRNLLHIELSRYTLNGRVADLGGSIKSEYTRFLNGDHAIEIVNMDENTNPDFSFDLEKPLALESGAYDGVLCINTLEHIFDYKNLLSEINRILKNDGTLILAVPFLVQIH